MRDHTTDPVIAAVRRDLRPAPGAKASTWAGLQTRIEAGDEPLLPPAPPWPSARAPFWIGAAIAVAAAVLLVTWIRGQRVEAVDEGQRSQAADDAKARATTGETTQRRVRTDAQPRAIETGPAPTTQALRGTVPVTPPAIAPVRRDDGGAEVDLIVRARKALVDGDAEAALGLARDAARRYPNGTLALERGAIEIGALCRLGRGEEAHASAQALARDHAGSEVAAALAKAPCEDG